MPNEITVIVKAITVFFMSILCISAFLLVLIGNYVKIVNVNLNREAIK